MLEMPLPEAPHGDSSSRAETRTSDFPDRLRESLSRFRNIEFSISGEFLLMLVSPSGRKIYMIKNPSKAEQNLKFRVLLSKRQVDDENGIRWRWQQIEVESTETPDHRSGAATEDGGLNLQLATLSVSHSYVSSCLFETVPALT